MKRWRKLVAILFGVVFCHAAFAIGVETLLLSPGLSLTTLQERIGRLEGDLELLTQGLSYAVTIERDTSA